MAPQNPASVSRSQVSSQDLVALSDQLLQASLTRTAAPMLVSAQQTTSSSAVSLSRTSMSQADLISQANSLPRDPATSHSPSSQPSAAPATDHKSRYNSKSRRSSHLCASNTVSTSISRARTAVQQLPSTRTSDRGQRSDPSVLKKQLQIEMDHANARTRCAPTTGLFKEMCSTDLLFLIDTTFSMGPYITSVRNQVKSIVADIKRTFLEQADVRIAVVSYKDHGFTSDIAIQSLDFTESVDEVHTFVDSLDSGGTTSRGLDWPENALGGLSRALQQSWRQQTRCLVHIADAPPHGRTLHDLPAGADEFYVPGSEPHGLVHEPLLRKAIQLNINYALLRITQGTQGTDRMALVFSHVYGVENASLLPSNLYFHELSAAKLTSSAVGSKTELLTEPHFEELALGTTYTELRHLVCKSVTNSFTRTAGRITRARRPQSQATGCMPTVDEEGDPWSNSSQRSLENVTPQWSNAGWFTDSFDTEGFCPSGVHDFSTLNEMMDSDANIQLSTAEFVVHARSKPFGRGAMRTATYARTAASNSPFVVKAYIKPGQLRPQMIEDMKIQALCKAFALEFNGLLKIDPLLDFVVTSCLQIKFASGTQAPDRSISLEPYIDGTYVKYNNNHTYVNPDSADQFNQLVQAFSHFTFERSYGHLLVNDLQGEASSRTLTDPAIQTLDPQKFKLTDVNLGEASIKLFFVGHQCNNFCHELGLKSSKAMFTPGAPKTFREVWPNPEPTVFCSNKLCRKIMRLARAKESTKYPGYQWCSACWPQLDLYKTQSMCQGPNGGHEFELSEFFHQSQGEPKPRECELHRHKDIASSSAAAVGGGMFSRMKSKQSSKSIAGSIAGKVW